MCCFGGLVLLVLIILLSHLGQVEIIRNMLGWSQSEKMLLGSGVWLFRGALRGENLFSSVSAQQETGFGPLGIPRALVRTRTGEARYRATYWRAVLATSRRCVEGCRTS